MAIESSSRNVETHGFPMGFPFDMEWTEYLIMIYFMVFCVRDLGPAFIFRMSWVSFYLLNLLKTFQNLQGILARRPRSVETTSKHLTLYNYSCLTNWRQNKTPIWLCNISGLRFTSCYSIWKSARYWNNRPNMEGFINWTIINAHISIEIQETSRKNTSC